MKKTSSNYKAVCRIHDGIVEFVSNKINTEIFSKLGTISDLSRISYIYSHNEILNSKFKEKLNVILVDNVSVFWVVVLIAEQPVLGPFRSYEEAYQAELNWLDKNGW